MHSGDSMQSIWVEMELRIYNPENQIKSKIFKRITKRFRKYSALTTNDPGKYFWRSLLLKRLQIVSWQLY